MLGFVEVVKVMNDFERFNWFPHRNIQLQKCNVNNQIRYSI